MKADSFAGALAEERTQQNINWNMETIRCFRETDESQLCGTRYIKWLISIQTSGIVYKWKYCSVFRENRCPPPPKPVYGDNFSHEAVTLKITCK